MKSIIITNIVVLNGGDGAILFGMIKILRRAFGDDCNIQIYASHPEVASRMFPEIEFRETLGLAATRAPFSQTRFLGRIFRDLQQARYKAAAFCWSKGLHFAALLLPQQQRKYLVEYSAADCVASSGGTYLKEEYGVLSQACDYTLTQLLSRPLVFFTQSLGPFKQPETRKLLAPVFRQSPCIMLRDEKSRRHLLELGINDSTIHLAADAAFALADPKVIEAARQEKTRDNAPFKVAISVRYWQHFASCTNEVGAARYRQSVAEAARRLVLQGAEVTFISTCQGIAEYDDDSAEADAIVGLLEHEIAAKIRVEHDFIRFDDLMVRLQGFDLCIGTRMHMCILSLISGTPVLPISYEFKTQELFAGLGMADWVTDIESISPVEFAEHVLAFRRTIPELRDSLFAKVLALNISAMRAGDKIRDSLKNVK